MAERARDRKRERQKEKRETETEREREREREEDTMVFICVSTCVLLMRSLTDLSGHDGTMNERTKKEKNHSKTQRKRQCDQIWRSFATLATKNKSFAILSRFN